jgi:hypothetical protein
MHIVKKMSDNKTIYEQRYETYRHLDKLRWFIFQIAISVVTGIIVLKDSIQESNIFAIGLMLFLSGMLIIKINYGIDKNNIVLRNVGIKIGDESIPISKKYKYKSISWLIAFCLVFTGAVMLLPFICSLFIN